MFVFLYCIELNHQAWLIIMELWKEVTRKDIIFIELSIYKDNHIGYTCKLGLLIRYSFENSTISENDFFEWRWFEKRETALL